MAGKAAKKQLQENQKALARLRIGMLTSNAVFILIRMAWYYDSLTIWHMVGYVLCNIVLFFAYRFFERQTTPTYDEDGQLAYAGGDLGSAGVNEYAHDIVYIIWFTLAAGSFSNYFWLTLLLIPGYALFKAPGLIKRFTGGGSGAEESTPELDEKARRKAEKKERKANQPRVVYRR